MCTRKQDEAGMPIDGPGQRVFNLIPKTCGVLLASALMLGGCSTMEDVGDAVGDAARAANPLNWFGDESKTVATDTAESPVADAKESGAYPDLNTVPAAPKTSTAEERQIIQEGLFADRANARHADGPPPRLYPKLAKPGAKSPRTPVEEASLGPPRPGAATSAARAPAEPVKIVTVRFQAGSEKMPDDTVKYLREVVAVQQRFGGKLRVVGHADGRDLDPDPDKNRLAKFNLSIGRANAVASALVSLGIGRDQLEIQAKGDSEPVAPLDDAARQAENRRVEVFLDRAKK